MLKNCLAMLDGIRQAASSRLPDDETRAETGEEWGRNGAQTIQNDCVTTP